MGNAKSVPETKIERPTKPVSRMAFWLLLSLALVLRIALFPYVSGDSAIYLLPWMDEFRANGAAALGGEFSNYNFPYLFLMYLGSLLPVEPLIAIKIVSLLGDVLLAVSMGKVVAHFQPSRLAPAIASLIVLYLPTVLLNASMWGQCDSFYASFLLLSLRGVLKGEGREAWVWWAIAFSFKLQAVFFLPALLVISIRNRYQVGHPLVGFGVWLLLSLPPILFGRSFGSTMSIYLHQTQEDRLVAGAANIYAWLPTVSAAEGRIPAILICGAALLYAAAGYWQGLDTPQRRVLFGVAVLTICPLLLPQMHDRYYFAAEVMSLLLLRCRGLVLVPCLLAGTGLFVYVLYFSNNQYLWPLLPASVLQCIAVVLLLRALWRKQEDPKVLPGA